LVQKKALFEVLKRKDLECGFDGGCQRSKEGKKGKEAGAQF
jgi:hypothetical protein